MIFLYRLDIDEYKTIHKEDEKRFLSIFCNITKKDAYKELGLKIDFPKEEYDIIGRIDNISKENKNQEFKPCNFSIIKDSKQIKEILDKKYSSLNRGEEYTEGLPSATVINALCPMNITAREFNKNKIFLLKWINDVSLERKAESKKTTLISLDSGTYIHKVLEMALLDNCRNFDKLNRLQYYISQANTSEECYKKIKDFDDKKQELADKAEKCLSKFFVEELPKIDLVFSEIFLKTDKIQGSADLVNYKDFLLYISDFKTSKDSYHTSKYEDFCRQLYIYTYMMLVNKFITQKQFDTMNYQVYFFNWNSGRYKIIDIAHKDVMAKKRMCHYILDWYWAVKNEKLEEFYGESEVDLPQTDAF